MTANPRRDKGAVLARQHKAQRIDGNTWIVAGRDPTKPYTVDRDTPTAAWRCDCPDHRFGGGRGAGRGAAGSKCKHIWAVTITDAPKTFGGLT